jgi:hypothetical protein
MEIRLDALVAAALGGDRQASLELARMDWPVVVRRLEHHGVLPLVADMLLTESGVAPAVRAALHDETTRHAAADLVREFELTRLLDAFDHAGIGAIVMKGAHLAYSHYARPDLRPRVDTDLLVAEAARVAAHDVLEQLGYEAAGQVSGTLLTYQSSYIKRRDGAASHIVDVHWRVANPQAFAGVFSYEEMLAQSVRLPRLGPSARGLSDVHALLVACVHRVAHHFDTDRLIWLHDIHLVASRLDAAGWSRSVDLAVARGVATVCLQSLRRTQDVYRTFIPAETLHALQTRAGHADRATAAYLIPSRRRRMQVLTSDLRALPSWTDRLRLVRQHLFPSAPYMRTVYAPESTAPLVMLYAQRGLRGARKWLARQ